MDDNSKAETQRLLATWTDEQYAMVATRMFDKAVAGKAMTLGYQLDLGKWMLASLLVVNGGALVAIANADDAAAKLFMAGGAWFVAGMVAALISGFFGWANAAIAAEMYDDASTPWALVSRANWPTLSSRMGKAITATTALSVLTGFGSVACFTVGALASGAALTPLASQAKVVAKSAVKASREGVLKER
jgi:hypothetical protein